MTAGLFGIIAAIAWGSADFIARFTGRDIGSHRSLFGMLAVGVIALSLFIWYFDISFVWNISKLWLLFLSGILIMLSTLLLYQALALGPVTIVAPIVGSYPVFTMILAVIMGVHPTPTQWIATFCVLIGVWIVGTASDHFLDQPEYTKQHFKKVIFLSICSATGFGIFIAITQSATQYYGGLQTIYLSRCFGLILLGLFFIKKHISPKPIIKTWRLIILQGLLDTAAVTSLILAVQTENVEIAVVASSGFCIITVLLARFILHEKMSWNQWGGVALIVSGVAVLSAIK